MNKRQVYAIEVGAKGQHYPLTMLVSVDAWHSTGPMARLVLFATLQHRALAAFGCDVADLDWSVHIRRSFL